MMQNYGLGGIALLAEKIEGHDDFKQAVDLGYAYFQGYFFCKPQIVQGRDIPASKANYLLFLKELNQQTLDFGKLESIIKREMSLSVRLLRYLNSASIGMRHRVSSIHHALTLMGEGPLRKWASIVAMIAIADNKPQELMTTCLVRGRFCEQVGNLLGLEEQHLDLFLIGCFPGLML
ncbi:MAG: HDOD domain-containing protein [Phycisphaerales bacterium]|nr:HDOD domain-containing protein [Phycisphaerales bacterium]